MTDTLKTIDALPDGKAVTIQTIYGSQDVGLQTDDLKKLAADVRRYRAQLASIEYLTRDHEEPDHHCVLCLIAGHANGKIKPYTEDTDEQR